MNPIVKHLLLNSGIVRRGLVAEYRFNEGAGQILYDYRNGNNGQLGSTTGADTNDPTWSTQGLVFSADDYVTVANNGLINNFPGGITIFLGFSVDATGTEQYVLSKNSFNQYKVSISATGYYVFTVKTSTGVKDLLSSDAVTTGTFVCVSCRYTTGGEISIWLNGVKTGTSTYTGAILPSETSLEIGRRSTGTYLSGGVSTALIYSVPLTDNEIGQNYRALKTILAGRGVSI